MSPLLFDAWRAAAEQPSTAERAVFAKTVDALRPDDLPTGAELSNAVLLRLRASELLQKCLDETLRQGRT
jgi:hypothetical protein